MFLNGFLSEEKKAAFASFVKWFLVSADDAGVAGSLHKTNGALYSVNVYTDVPAGNAASFEHLLAHTRALDLDPSAIVIFLEDDTLLSKSSLIEMVEIFHSHDPCFVTPIDSADLYTFGDKGIISNSNKDPIDEFLLAPSQIVAGRRRHWRTVQSTTVTYAARQGTLDFFASRIPIPSDDFLRLLSLVRDFDVSILSPLPSLALVCESLSDFTEPSFPFYTEHRWARELYVKGKQRHLIFLGSCDQQPKRNSIGAAVV